MFLVNGCSKGDSDLRLPLQDLCEGVAVGEPLIKGWVGFGWGKGRCNHASGQEKDRMSSWGSSLCLLCHSVVLPHLAWGQTSFLDCSLFCQHSSVLQQTSVKPTPLSCQLNALKALYQLEEGRTVVWRGRACCSVVALFENFIRLGYGGSSQQLLNLTNTGSVCGKWREGEDH